MYSSLHFARRRAWLALLIANLALTATADAQIGHRQGHYRNSAPYRYCPPQQYAPYYSELPSATAPETIAPGAGDRSTGPDTLSPDGLQAPGAQPGTSPTGAEAAMAAPAPSNVASAPSSAAPSMVGDHFGNGFQFNGGGDLSVAGGL